MDRLTTVTRGDIHLNDRMFGRIAPDGPRSSRIVILSRSMILLLWGAVKEQTELDRPSRVDLASRPIGCQSLHLLHGNAEVSEIRSVPKIADLFSR